MEHMIVNEFRKNIRSKLFKEAKENADEIINKLVEEATYTFKRKLKEELYNNLDYIVDYEMNHLEIKSNINYDDANINNITVRILSEED